MTKSRSITSEDRRKIEEKLTTYGIKKLEIAASAKVSERTVIRFFQNQSDNLEVYKAARKLIIQKISLINQRHADATNDLMEIAAA